MAYELKTEHTGIARLTSIRGVSIDRDKLKRFAVEACSYTTKISQGATAGGVLGGVALLAGASSGVGIGIAAAIAVAHNVHHGRVMKAVKAADNADG